MHKVLYKALMRLPINAFQFSLSEDQRNFVESKTAAIEESKLNLGPEKNNIQGWYDPFKQFVDDLGKNGGDLSKF